MVKDQEFLETKASYCLGLAKKLGATDSSVIVKNSISETVNFRNKKLEAAASNDKKIVNTESSFTQNKSNFVLANSEGFCDGYKTSSFTASSVTVAKDEKSMERDYEYSSKCFLKDLDLSLIHI